MSRKKVFKNPDVNDIQRERVLKRRILEERAKAEEIWKWKESKTKPQKLADYLKGKKIADHITTRIMRGVLYGLKYGMSVYPKTPEEKYFDARGLNLLRQLISKIRRDPEFRWFSVATEVPNENPDTRDLEYVCYDFAAEQGRKTKKTKELAIWEANRQQILDTMLETKVETVDRALLPELERRRLEKEENKRRKRRNGDGNN